MVEEADIKRNVRDFYDRIGWQEVSDGIFQNAVYEDLRPVSRKYIHDCHMRVLRHLKPHGRLLLDAGSGPIQYPEYLEYSQGYQYRVCADISVVALQEARRRIGSHGMFVVTDIANLPFVADVFDGVLSMHTIHHLPKEEQLKAFQELYRVAQTNSEVVVINGWSMPPLIRITEKLADGLEWLRRKKRVKRKMIKPVSTEHNNPAKKFYAVDEQDTVKGTYVRKHNAAWALKVVGKHMPVKIWVWRSVNVRFLRSFIHEKFGGKIILDILYWLEERFPHFLGKAGQYPLIVIHKR